MNDYYPPVGYYEVKIDSTSRKVDFGTKPINSAKKDIEANLPGPGAYLSIQKSNLPSIITN